MITEDGSYIQILYFAEDPLPTGHIYEYKKQSWSVVRSSVKMNGLYKSHLVKVETSKQS